MNLSPHAASLATPGRTLLVRALLALLVTSHTLTAALWAADPRAATTSREARQEALSLMPLAQMTPEDRAAASYVLQNTSVYRRMPTEVIDCDPHLFALVLDNPEILTNIWQLMKISDVKMVRTGPNTYKASDGQGTEADLRILSRAADKVVLYAEGSYSGPLISKPIRGRCVLLLQSQGIRETNGRFYMTCRLDSFLHMERAGIDLLAKTFHPLMGRAADTNFSETIAFLSHLSRTAEMNPTGTARMAQMLTGVDPQVRAQLGQIAHHIAGQHADSASAIRPAAHQVRPTPTAEIADRAPRQPVQE